MKTYQNFINRRALITGITGQDGSYLAEFLLDKGYDVYGIVRRASTNNLGRIEHIKKSLTLFPGDLSDHASLDVAVRESKPDEIYNLAAQSFVGYSWGKPVFTGNIDALGVTRLLESMSYHVPSAKFYQASSSEMFGKVVEDPQKESTPFYPRSPYGVAKAYAHWITINYRESNDIFAVSGICFDHTSERRGEEFVGRKISKAVARIEAGLQDILYLGNTKAKRDWGFAGDYVEAMWLMLQAERPEDYIIATGETYSVEDFAKEAFAVYGLDYKKYIAIDKSLFRPAEVDVLRGDSTRIRKNLGWKPKYNFKDLVRRMVLYDSERILNGKM